MYAITIFKDPEGYRVRRFNESGELELVVPDGEPVMLPLKYARHFEQALYRAAISRIEDAHVLIEDTIDELAWENE